MIALAIDTATEAFSVAVKKDGFVYEHFEIAPREHGDKLLPVLDQLLIEAGATMRDVSQVVYGRGPGAFTGVRIAISAAQGLAMGADCPMIGVSSLQNLAHQAFQQTDATIAIVAMDARMGEVYVAAFRAERTASDGKIWPTAIIEEQVIAPEKLSALELDPQERMVTIGSGWDVYEKELKHYLSITPHFQITEAFPKAGTALLLAEFEHYKAQAHLPEQAVPVYLRNQVAKKSQKPGLL